MAAPLDQTFFEYQPTKDLNRLLREYGRTILNDNLPSPPEGTVNIHWQTDSMGNISAYYTPGGGSGGVTSIVAGNNVTISPSDGLGAVTINSTASGTVNVLPRGEYNSGTTYAQNDVVYDTGGSYISRVNNNTGNNPLTDNDAWAPFAAQGPQGGGVQTSTANKVAFYTSDGTGVEGGSNTSSLGISNANQSNQWDLFFAGTLDVGFSFQQPVTLPSSTFYPSINNYSYFQDWTVASLNGTIQGSGFSFGNAGGWTVGKGLQTTFNTGVRGIHQNISHIINKHSTGDTAASYGYVFSDGGVSAASDEGVTGTQSEINENFGYYHGTVTSSTGVNDRAPVWSAATSGNNWTTDGAFMMNISRPFVTSRVTSGGSNITDFTINGQTVASYFYQLNCTTSSIPISTAVGYQVIPNWSNTLTYTNREVVLWTDGHVYQSTGDGNVGNSPATGGTSFWTDEGVEANNNWLGIPNQSCTADSPVPCTFTVALVTFNGATNGFSVGDHVSVAGTNYPEQSVVTAVTTTGSGISATQRVTMLLRNPNYLVTLFKGGVAGGYISSAANLAFSGMRSSYYAFGSLDGNTLIYGLQVSGGIQSNVLPQTGSEQWSSDGSANAEFTVYPGAEIVSNPDYYNPAGHIEQNNIAWTAGDLVENPHYPVFGGTAAWFTKNQTTPSNPGHGSSGIQLDISGTGWAGGNTAHLRIDNLNPSTYYLNGGGPAANVLFAPYMLELNGPYNTGIYFSNGPQAGTGSSLIRAQAPFDPSDTTSQVSVLRLDWCGQLFAEPSLGRFGFDVDLIAGNYWTNQAGNIHQGVSGTWTSADGKTITAVQGLVVSIV